MESLIIWLTAGLFGLFILIGYWINFRRRQKKTITRHQEAVRLGADRAVAQHPQIDPLACIGCGACVAACPEGEVLGLVNGKAVIINGLKCVGHGKCAEACPVEGITIGLGNIKERDDLPFLDENLQTNLPGVYIAGELGGLALIRNAIAQGTRVIDAISQNPRRNKGSYKLDVVIAGAGPAGLSAALRAIEQKMSFVLIDQQDAGGTLLQYPKKKLVMTRPVEIPLYGWLSKPEYSKEELLEIWNDARKKFNINLISPEKLSGLKKNENSYELVTSQRSYSASNVILALGRRGTPRKLNIPGEEKSKVMYQLMDAETYQQEHLLVVGGGDSAIEAAVGLARQHGNKVTLSYRKDKFFRIKTRNQQKIDELIRDKKINIFYEAGPVEIKDKSVRLTLKYRELEIENDYVFIFAGGDPPFALLKAMGIQFGAGIIPDVQKKIIST